MRLWMRGDLISDRSKPPGVYVKGFLSLLLRVPTSWGGR